MAAPAKVSKRRSNFRIRQCLEKHNFNIAANLTFNTMVSFVILLVARTARIACADRQTGRHTHTHTHETTTVTLSAQTRRGLIMVIKLPYDTKCNMMGIDFIIVLIYHISSKRLLHFRCYYFFQCYCNVKSI